MSNELLRIHDENNNCDLVAVANPMGNFHMSTYAEMQDGTQKPVDGWYLFSKMIEKLGQGGGGDSVDMIISRNTEGRYVIESGSFELIHEKIGNLAMPKIIYVKAESDGVPNDCELSYRVAGNTGSFERDTMIYVYFSNQFKLCVDNDNNVYDAE